MGLGDLGERKPVGTIRWVFGEYGIGDYFEIEGSNNLVTWEYITKRNGKPVGVWQEKTLKKNYRYIRFRFVNKKNRVVLGGLAEVQVWSPGLAPPIGTTATPTPTRTPTMTPTIPADNAYQMTGSHGSANATDATAVKDGDLGSMWQTNQLTTPTTANVYISLGTSKPIGQIRWRYGASGMGDAMSLQVSDDRLLWNQIYSDTDNSNAGEWFEFSPASISAKYVRWVFTNPNGDAVIGGISEVQIYPPGSSGPTSTRRAVRRHRITPPVHPPRPQRRLRPWEGGDDATATGTPTASEIATETAAENATETPTVLRPRPQPKERLPLRLKRQWKRSTETATQPKHQRQPRPSSMRDRKPVK